MISDAQLLDWTKANAGDTATLRLLEQAAIKAAEQITGRYLGVATAITEVVRFNRWPIALANEPVAGAITSLKQWDGSAFTLVAAADYYVDGSFIWPNATFAWTPDPTFTTGSKRFQVIYQAGYTVDGTDANVWAAPKDIQAAILLLVGHWNENRESVVVGTSAVEVPFSVQTLLSAHARTVV